MNDTAKVQPDWPAREQAEAAFLAAYPAYLTTQRLDELRQTEYGRLDEQGHVYLDYTGGGLYADAQLRQHMDMLRHNVYGNPHSHNPTAQAMTELVERARAYVFDYFNIQPAEYVVIFTPNASGALKLVGEAYPFAPGGQFALSTDDHNSVNGIREFARARGATVTYIPLTMPDLRLDLASLDTILDAADPAQPNLLAYPAQSNYSGVQHPLDLIERARAKGWDVLVDCAAFAPSNRLDLGYWQPDFASFSFYKMFGYPTGVGALVARRTALAQLRRPWFAGGTIRIASVTARGHYLADGEAGFEDGTVNYLALPAIEIGLRHLQAIGIDTIHERVRCLTGWLLDQLLALRHASGRPLVRLHGPKTLEARGGTITMSFFDAEGTPISGQWVERLAGEQLISLRTGCFCNPGAGETTFELPPTMMRAFFSQSVGLHFTELVDAIYTATGVDVSGVRVSVGLVSNFADVYRFIEFARGFLNQTVRAIEHFVAETDTAPTLRDTA